MTSPVLVVDNLSISTLGKSPRRILDDVSFDVRPGEMVCIVGESGSGKSLTSLSVMGLTPRDSLSAPTGRILLDGEDILQAAPRRIRDLRATSMAMVFQEPMTALNPVHTVGAQIDEVLRTHTRLSKEKRREDVIAMLKAVHLPDVERIYNSYPHQLSGGQRQRIVISMALILKPKLLIADEPTTALDVTTQKQILMLIRELQDQQKTAVMFITHDFGVVAEIADRIVVMNKGRVVEVGEREAILARPRDDYTRMLVSAVPSLVPHGRAAPVGENILTVRNLGKVYRDNGVAAATDVNLTIARGEVVGIVGESGSGKSTVARCIVRLVDPSTGKIQIDGSDIASLSRRALRPLRQRFQIVFQDP